MPARHAPPPTIPHLTLTGASPHALGVSHGTQAAPQIQGSLSFYAAFFLEKSGLSWPAVREVAARFEPVVQRALPDLGEEMRGIAEGAGVAFLDVLALNVRTEIAYGLMSDGCTAFGWLHDGAKNGKMSYLAQNWDWSCGQKGNLLHVRIERAGRPAVEMVTEAGIVGKIGMNGAGVGVTLNAIAAKGVDFDKVPCHLALRSVLDSGSRGEAVERLRRLGVASSCHIQIADRECGAVGLEVS
jgi:isopenicillin-N N-acyltransferase like protein